MSSKVAASRPISSLVAGRLSRRDRSWVVVGGRQVEPARQVFGRDAPRGAGDLVDRRQGAGRQEVTAQCGEQGQERPADQQRRQEAVQRILSIPQRLGRLHDADELPVLYDRRSVEAYRFALARGRDGGEGGLPLPAGRQACGIYRQGAIGAEGLHHMAGRIEEADGQATAAQFLGHVAAFEEAIGKVDLAVFDVDCGGHL